VINRWRKHTMQQVERASDGRGGETTRWNKWREQVMEEVEKPQDGTSGESK
jgi:hypothetical protein